MPFTLEELKDTLLLFSSTQSQFLTENCIVALEDIPHQTGCNLKVTGDNTDIIPLLWTTNVTKAGYQEPKKFTEKGAEAISFFLAKQYTNFDILLESFTGTGIDYWLGYNDDHKDFDKFNPFRARLEISGILKETRSNSFNKRITEKKDQTKPSDNTNLPAYISIVEFSTPKAYFAKK